jgi:hypothetical protein
MLFVFRVKNQASQDNQQLCWSFRNLYLIRDTWTFHLLVGILLGLIILRCSHSLELIGFSYPWNGRSDFLKFLKGDSLESCRIIFC